MEMPHMIYGTAWKEDTTADLVVRAVKSGFNGIDTANQPKHYNEPAVGLALRQILSSGRKRESLFLQTKYTLARGQDHRIPYDQNADFAVQVQQSFASSLHHLGVDYVDSYLVHGPTAYEGLEPSDFEVWRAFEELYRSGRAKMIGVSNFSAGQLLELISESDVKPMVVQNRCFANRGWDRDVRVICREEGILYQGFSLLTANLSALDTPRIWKMAEAKGMTIPQIVFRFAQQVGMIVLNGTTQEEHMVEGLAAANFTLNDAEIQTLDQLYLGSR